MLNFNDLKLKLKSHMPVIPASPVCKDFNRSLMWKVSKNVRQHDCNRFYVKRSSRYRTKAMHAKHKRSIYK